MYINSEIGYSTKPCTAQITKRKNRLKVYSTSEKQVFMNDGDEFEIELFNPKKSPVLAKISLNGKSISQRGVVLYPGQRVFLERFLDTPEKFKFSTYKVNNSKEVKEAIANNGLVRIEFYDEIPFHNTYSGITWTTTPNNWNFTTNFPNFNSATGGSLSTGGTTVNNLFNYSTTSNSFNETTTSTVNASFLNRRADALETGRVEAGSGSDQKFTSVNGNFNAWASTVVEYKIVPIGEKPVEVSEIRNYCTGCGTRNKKDWRFCPTCGQKF